MEENSCPIPEFIKTYVSSIELHFPIHFYGDNRINVSHGIVNCYLGSRFLGFSKLELIFQLSYIHLTKYIMGITEISINILCLSQTVQENEKICNCSQ
jgi:hypothetical protein